MRGKNPLFQNLVLNVRLNVKIYEKPKKTLINNSDILKNPWLEFSRQLRSLTIRWCNYSS